MALLIVAADWCDGVTGGHHAPRRIFNQRQAVIAGQLIPRSKHRRPVPRACATFLAIYRQRVPCRFRWDGAC